MEILARPELKETYAFNHPTVATSIFVDVMLRDIIPLPERKVVLYYLRPRLVSTLAYWVILALLWAMISICACNLWEAAECMRVHVISLAGLLTGELNPANVHAKDIYYFVLSLSPFL